MRGKDSSTRMFLGAGNRAVTTSERRDICEMLGVSNLKLLLMSIDDGWYAYAAPDGAGFRCSKLVTFKDLEEFRRQRGMRQNRRLFDAVEAARSAE